MMGYELRTDDLGWGENGIPAIVKRDENGVPRMGPRIGGGGGRGRTT